MTTFIKPLGNTCPMQGEKLLGNRVTEFIKDYPKMGNHELAKKYGLSYKQVKSLGERLGLRKDPQVKRKLLATSKITILPEDKIEEFKRDYPVLTLEELMKKYNLTKNQIYMLARRFGLKKNSNVIYEQIAKDKTRIFGEYFEKEVISPPPHEISYIAGFLDGEGCFTICKHKRGNEYYFRPVIAVCNTNRDVIEFIAKKFGGMFQKTKPSKRGHRDRWQWSTENREKIIKICEMLIPHLIIKKRQAELLKRWCELSIETNTMDNSNEEMRKIYEEIKKLNARGRKASEEIRGNA